MAAEVDDVDEESKDSDLSASTCPSSCEEEGSHWDSASASSDAEEVASAAKIGGDDERDEEVTYSCWFYF